MSTEATQRKCCSTRERLIQHCWSQFWCLSHPARQLTCTCAHVQLLGVWVEPLVEIEVSQTASQVVLKVGATLQPTANAQLRQCKHIDSSTLPAA